MAKRNFINVHLGIAATDFFAGGYSLAWSLSGKLPGYPAGIPTDEGLLLVEVYIIRLHKNSDYKFGYRVLLQLELVGGAIQWVSSETRIVEHTPGIDGSFVLSGNNTSFGIYHSDGSPSDNPEIRAYARVAYGHLF